MGIDMKDGRWNRMDGAGLVDVAFVVTATVACRCTAILEIEVTSEHPRVQAGCPKCANVYVVEADGVNLTVQRWEPRTNAN